jgi:hypothetical protein
VETGAHDIVITLAVVTYLVSAIVIVITVFRRFSLQ